MSTLEREKLFKKYDITFPFILTVGTLEPRKNLKFLLSLMPLLAQEKFQLIIVGAKGWGNVKLNSEANGLLEKIKFAGFVPDEDLIKLYNTASVCVSTSLNEGFCVPLLEAMLCGCPVVASHNSGMIEVVEGGGETIKSWSTDIWVEAIEKVACQKEIYAQKGFAKAKLYSWSEVVHRITRYIEAVT